MAPELLSDAHVGVEGDVYALGVVFLQVCGIAWRVHDPPPPQYLTEHNAALRVSWLPLQVATGLPARVPTPTPTRPSLTTHISDHVTAAIAGGSLPSLFHTAWADASVLREFVDIGLACCAVDPEARPTLRAARGRLAALLTRLPAGDLPQRQVGASFCNAR
jgi:hypothetical protein